MVTKAPAWRNRIVGYEADVDPAQLLANPLNWRTHSGDQRGALRGALGQVGWVDAVMVNTTTGHVVDGHARIEEAISAGSSVPVMYVELTAEEEALVLASFDPIGAMAGTDKAQLAEVLAGLTVDDEALRRMLADLGGPEGRVAGKTDPDDLPPLREPDVHRGELWALGAHRLLVGDATAAGDVATLVAGAAVDLVWTDPPYGVDYVGKTEERLRIRDDLPAQTRALLIGALSIAPLKPGGVYYIAAPAGPALRAFLEALDEVGWPLRQQLVWVKDRFVLGHSDFHYRHEAVLVGDVAGAREHDVVGYGWNAGAPHRFDGGRKLDTVWEIPRPSASREHPTMKPVDLVARALEYSTAPGERVYDAFAGSGTTVIAAEQLGRVALAMEIDPRYAQVVIDRWEAFTGRRAERVS